MSTADKLNRVMQSKNEIRQAIIEKGVEVPEDTKLRDYPSKIAAIQTGNDYFEELLRIRTNNWTTGRYLFHNSNATSFDLSGIDFSKMSDMSYMFDSCGSLVNILGLDTSNATNMSVMFSRCSSLTTIPQLDTSNATNVYSMFYGCTSLTTIPQLDTSKVTNMSSMFSGCSKLNSVPQLDTSKVTNMSNMFYGCTSLTTIPQLNTSNATSVGSMFSNCTKLTKVPALDLNKCTVFSNMFQNCNSLVEVDSTLNKLAINKKIAAVLPTRSSTSKGKFIADYGSIDDALKNTLSSKNWDIDTTYPLEIKTSDTTGTIRVATDIGAEYSTEVNVADMPTKLDKDGSVIRYYDSHDIVYVGIVNMTNLTEIVNYKMPKKVLYKGSVQLFNRCTNLTTVRSLDLSNHQNINNLFQGCTSLTTLPEEIDFSNATTIANLFYGCTSLTTLPKLVNTSNVTNMIQLFYDCTQLTSIPEIDTSSVTNMSRMFSGCTNLTGYADPDKFWNNSKVTVHLQCFTGCTKLDNYADIPDDWK